MRCINDVFKFGFTPGLNALLLLAASAGIAFSAKKDEPKPTPWSFSPLKRTELPAVKNTAWPRTRLDYYILAKMEAAGAAPSPRADENTLLRRLSFDVTGLPPAAGSLHAAPSEWNRAVDEQLRSPQYGERWARHWLDLARYTDQTPDWLDSTKYSYLYRDWVVQAFNEDMPYNRFVIRQLATDFLPECGPQDRVALGFIGLSPSYFKELQLPPEIIKTTVADEWEEHVDAVGRTFLGLTLACARCHDHKSDPITAKDYYALAGVFASVKITERPMMSDDLWKPVEKARAEVATLEKRVADLKKAKSKDLAVQTAALEGKISTLKAATPHYDMLMANAVEEAALFVVKADNTQGTKMDYRAGMARDLELQKRGNPNDTGDVVPRRFLSAFPSKTGLPRKFETGSGRLELAEAIVEDAAPLTARVIVNRVWKHHFGRGLVDTPSEFGNLGEPPTHPELLDDLAGRFMEHGWSLKWLHREILDSATWQQASVAAESERLDPEDKLYSRMTRRRLDWESWRDAILSATGRIDLTMGGVATSISDVKNQRRSLYGASDRQDMDPMLRIHDVPDPGSHNPWRTETITPLQGLFALNSPFMQQQADVLGRWLQAQGDQRLTEVYERLFQRKPSGREMRAAQGFLSGRETDAAAWSQYAQALLAGNEMLFVD
ncbi:MAG: Planctomycete cytochrome [Verrucomicrobiaceae bacterium]|nr:Planctomycete cytochrome [Verrucomicrobiaceae bacterium]